MHEIPLDMRLGTVHNTLHCGLLKIVKYESSKAVTVRFDAPVFTTVTTAQNIRNGQVKNRLLPSVFGVGYLGVGNYKSKINGIQTSAYRCWLSMLERCYSFARLKKHPSYRGCTVSPCWHNFQEFAAWHEENYPTDGGSYDLDKDIKVQGNRVYSPDTCMFVTGQENQAERNVRVCSKKGKFLSPEGEVFNVVNIREFCREKGLHQSYMSQIASGKLQQYKGWKAA